MIIECPYCESKVDGQVKGEVEIQYDPDEPPRRIVLVECPLCNKPLLGRSECYQVDYDKYEWSDLNRLWPEQESLVNWEFPNIVRKSLKEAKICFKAKAYSASVVMSGCALEGVTKHYGTRSKNFAKGLNELKEKEIIDNRLFEWGEELRKHRNISAHPSDQEISKDDAQDLLEFANAICEYVFVLTERFNKFMERKSKA